MNPVKETIKPIMKDNGFRCKRTSWYRRVNDVIQILNIQKSVWSNLYYINIGFDPYDETCCFPKDYSFPPEYKFRIRFRAEEIVENKDVLCSLDFEQPFSDRDVYIMDLIKDCLSFMDSLSTKEKVLSYHKKRYPNIIVRMS